jgi:hypothetical protein
MIRDHNFLVISAITQLPERSRNPGLRGGWYEPSSSKLEASYCIGILANFPELFLGTGRKFHSLSWYQSRFAATTSSLGRGSIFPMNALGNLFPAPAVVCSGIINLALNAVPVEEQPDASTSVIPSTIVSNLSGLM